MLLNAVGDDNCTSFQDTSGMSAPGTAGSWEYHAGKDPNIMAQRLLAVCAEGSCKAPTTTYFPMAHPDYSLRQQGIIKQSTAPEFQGSPRTIWHRGSPSALETHLPPAVSIEVVLFDDFNPVPDLERYLVWVLRGEVVQPIDIFRHLRKGAEATFPGGERKYREDSCSE
ncbi:hypothetical protein BD413DRAFT_302973 [Trametes elegans]|nr:hypothetical protein BD413DRAFT_302973 [Trametes elegans]